MKRTRTLGGIALALALGMGCGDVEFNAPDWPEWRTPDDPAAQVRVNWEWRGQVAAGQQVEVKTVFGDIRGVPTAGSEVVVKATKIGRAGAVDDVRIDVVPHASGVTICAVYPDVPGHAPNRCAPGDGGNMTVWDGGRGVVRVNFVVEVPDGVNLIAKTLW
ncbi:MAG: hypothetical protein JSW43_12205 [Gemmatimonadota bacterium]|nr:MAG: hypothetical protein JSW43_12205 [Gemmatimonadota bacterium]